MMHRLIANPGIYALWRSAIGGRRYREHFVSEYIKPRHGARILDLGCGTGHVAELLGSARYLGIDHSHHYIRYADKRYSAFGEFRCLDITDPTLEVGTFDLVIAMGVLHHLSDFHADRSLSLAARSIEHRGKFLAVDITMCEDDGNLSRWLVKRDRGEYVRSPLGYRTLARHRFGEVSVTVRRDLLRVPLLWTPYSSMAVLECGKPVEPPLDIGKS